MLMRFFLTTIISLLLFSASGYGADPASNDCIGKRYQDNNNGTITDCRTGLVWLKDANCSNVILGGVYKDTGRLNWQDAKKWVKGLGSSSCGLTDGSSQGDWRLPTMTELMAMVESAKKQNFAMPVLTDASGTAQGSDGNAFSNVQTTYYYWTSTAYPCFDVCARTLSLAYGDKNEIVQSDTNFVWPVRGGQTGSFGSVFVK
jgi:hypothetical protein